MNPQFDHVAEAERRHQAEMVQYRPLYRTWCLPSQEWQRCQLEKLRVKWSYRAGFRAMREMRRVIRRAMGF